MNRSRKTAAVLSAGLGLALGYARAQNAPAGFDSMSPRQINRQLHEISRAHPDLPGRIEAVSAAFLGTPYAWGPMGEGPNGRFDRNPLVSFKALDCTTFVEEVMAFSLDPDLSGGMALLQKIRYKNGDIAYQNRNHFPSVDWLPNNIAAGFIRDITREVAGGDTRVATKIISKRSWYARKNLADIKGRDDLSLQQKQELLAQFRALGENMPDEQASLPYLPIDLLPRYLNAIPSGTIVNLVRADKASIPVLVSHQFLIIDKDGGKYVREAALKDKVKDIPALTYFKIYQGSKWPLLGLNLDEILPQRRRDPPRAIRFPGKAIRLLKKNLHALLD